MAETLYLIDGHSMIYRAYYAPFRALTSPTGEPTRATHVFCQQLITFIAKRKPKYLAMAVDGPIEHLKRKADYADYKVSRKPMPSDLPPQVNRITQIVELMGIPVLRAPGYEADDVIATAVEKFAGPDMQVVMISRDKDLDQVVGDHSVLYDPMKDETLDAAAIRRLKGYGPDKAVEVQTLTGDSTDNIPGIPGVGPKKAAKLIEQYGSADEVVKHADELTPALKAAVLQSAAQLPLARKLVTLDRHSPIELSLENMRFSGIDGSKIRPLFAELGFGRLLDQLDKLGVRAAAPAGASGAFATSLFDAAEPSKPAAPSQAQPPRDEESAKTPDAGEMTCAADFKYELIDTSEKLNALAAELRGVTRLAFDTETTSTQPMWCDLVGVSLAWNSGHAVYLPIKGPLGACCLELEDVRAKIGPILADERIEKVAQHVKFDMIVLANAGIEVRGPLFDTMIAAYVLDSARPSYKLDALAAEFLNHRCIPIADLIGRGRKQITMDSVPLEQTAIYAAEDADVTLRLWEALEPKLRQQGLAELMMNLEMPLAVVLCDMERRGVRIDPQALRRLEIDISKQADALRQQIIECCGVNINPDSPRQLADVLFGKLGLPVIRKTATGPSTDSAVLEELADKHELPALVLEYRKLTKLLGTYLVGLRECINSRTGRVHTSFHQTATVTGRLSSSDPNLQNIPIRTELGRQIRSAFIADEGCVLLSADYSQVELRVLAHFCQDPLLMRAFEQDQDIHAAVAAEVFGVPLGEVTSEQRGRAKTVNFGIIYGQTAFGLAKTLRIGRTEAGEFIDAYRKRFPKIGEFLNACIDQAKELGYVSTLFGRRRSIVGLHAANPSERSAAERLAINSVVQGSAADLIKQAMLNIDSRIRRENRPSRMLLQIHDELLFETPSSAVESEQEMITHEMINAIKLLVPLKVDVNIGANWMDAK